ncbi:MAG: Asp-tRNA(Asn)/Glu-tRNA(Gln) amidotransferase subunit GatA, partial [Chloroflexi bacterium]|nr:Asp-tRNA(Asn)/Glu-tRNA(Gln) amidotransferase subunit GatA [Chloroflexota bacterium]
MEPHALTIHETRELLRTRAVSAVELTEALLARIAQVDERIRAYLCVTPEPALVAARQADERLAAGDPAPLLGIPLAIKDVLCTRGVATTCGSRILEGFVPPYDAAVVERLRAAGAILLGK